MSTNAEITIPGFTAVIVFEPAGRPARYTRVSKRLSDRQSVISQKSEFACGLALAGVLGGLVLGNPFAIIGGLAGISTQC